MPTNPKVDAFMTKLSHPLKDEMEAVRAIVLGASAKMEEEIKWSCPTFTYNGNLASIAVRTKKYVQLLFHTGSAIKDESGLLEGDGKVARYVNFADMAEIKKKKRALEAVVKEWVRMKSDRS